MAMFIFVIEAVMEPLYFAASFIKMYGNWCYSQTIILYRQTVLKRVIKHGAQYLYSQIILSNSARTD